MQFGEISDMCLIGRTFEVVQNLWFPILRKIVEKFRTLSVVVSRNANSVVITSEKIIYHMNTVGFDVLRSPDQLEILQFLPICFGDLHGTT